MKKLITIIVVFIFLFCPEMALAQTAESKSSPPIIQKIAPDQYYYNYNIEEIQKDPDGDGPLEAETFYSYNYVEIQGTPTKHKVIEAIKAAESSEVVVDVATDRSAAQEQLANIAGMSYAQIDTYVENTFGGLPAAQKTALKKLYKTVLAILKQMDLTE